MSSGTSAPGPRLRPSLDGIPTYKPGKPAGADAYKLSSNENPNNPLPGVLEAAVAAAGSFNRYPDMGVSELTAVLAERFGVGQPQISRWERKGKELLRQALDFDPSC